MLRKICNKAKEKKIFLIDFLKILKFKVHCVRSETKEFAAQLAFVIKKVVIKKSKH